MDIKTKFNIGEVACLNLGDPSSVGSSCVVKAVHVEGYEPYLRIAYTVNYGGESITVPESMLSCMVCTAHKEAEKEQGKKKELTADKLYELISKSRQIYWNEEYYDVFYSNEEEFCLHDGDFEEYNYTYEEFIEELKKSDFDITFYTLETLKY